MRGTLSEIFKPIMGLVRKTFSTGYALREFETTSWGRLVEWYRVSLLNCQGQMPPVLFFDRDVGIALPKALNVLRLPTRVEYHQDHFQQNAHDDCWMAEIGRRGWFAIGHDHHHHTRSLERDAIRDYSIGCFYLWGGDKPRYEKMRCFLSAYPNIIRAIHTTGRPFVYRIDKQGNLHNLDLGISGP